MKEINKRSNKVTSVVLAGTLSVASLGVGAIGISSLDTVEPAQAYATSSDTASGQSSPASTDANYEKGQVVYAKSSATGEVSGVHVVNSFKTDSNVTLSDAGSYTSISNLTNTNEIDTKNDNCTFTADGSGNFMYQGDLPTSSNLPWKLDVSYELDGKSVSAEELAGRNGSLSMKFKIEPTSSSTEMENYSNNYLIQATAKFDNSICSNIVADGATSAQSSGSTQLTYMVFPGKSGEFTITADVNNFEFDGLTVVGVPLSIALNIEDSEFDEAKEDLNILKDAIETLNDGASELRVGSSSFSSGLSKLSSNSKTLLNGSSKFFKALNSAGNAGKSLDNAVSNKLSSGIQQLKSGSSTYANSLNSQAEALSAKTAGKSVETLTADYASALSTYTQTYTAVYTQIYTALIQTGQTPAVASHAAATQAMQNESVLSSLENLNAKVKTLGETSGNLGALQALTEVSQGYSKIEGGISTFSTSVETLESGTDTLSSGLQELGTAYADLNSGIATYTAGVDTLAGNYSSLDSGLTTLASGTAQLQSETANIDSEMVSAVKDKLTEYLNPSFTLADFVNGSSDHIKSVQFVYMTEVVEIESEVAQQTEETTENKSFFEKFISLFTLCQ